jgi:hypothetical protein
MTVYLPEVTLEALQEKLPTQAFRLGKSLLSCGDVAGFHVSSTTEAGVKISGYVHSEKYAVKWYEVSFLTTPGLGIIEPRCVCLASSNMELANRPCKHISAVLFAVLALNYHSGDEVTPKLFRRPNMSRFAGAPEKLKSQVEYGLTWPEIISRITSDVPKKRAESTTYNKIVLTKEVKKNQKRKRIPGEYETYNVEELKKELKEKGYKVSGNKSALIERLKQ